MKHHEEKVVWLSDLRTKGSQLNASDVVVCFGHFNVIHPGHIRYFQRARSHGKTLLVAVEGDDLITGAERNHFYPEKERAEAICGLHLVDLVVILDSGTLEDLIDVVQPALLVLGKEFKDNYRSRVAAAVGKITEFGGSVVYDAGEIHYSTTELLYGSQSQIEEERWDQFHGLLNNHGIVLRELVDRVRKAEKPKILVVGDTIVDRYVACDPLGMSNEAPVVVVKELDSKDFIGGAAIVAAHIRALGANCDFISVIGADNEGRIVKRELQDYGVVNHLFEDPSRPTTLKLRYMVENQKLFRVSRLQDSAVGNEIENQIIRRIEDLVPNIDGIVVSDFVYGVVSGKVLECLSKISTQYDIPLFGDLQCSSQIGDFLKFKDFYLLSPTEREARIALRNQDDGVERVANMLIEKTNTKNLILKLAGDGFIAYSHDIHERYSEKEYFPALSANPIDVTGAGDSLLATTAMLMAGGFNLIEASIVGTCIASVAVQTVGNMPITLDKLDSMIVEGN
jgi:rfaE bifunctional protein kinase chain/domain